MDRSDAQSMAVDCPYIGLSPFDPAHELYFFGRDDDAQLIASHVVSGGVTVLQGASGVGKSSVLGAALPKALQEIAPGTLIISFRRWDLGFYDSLLTTTAEQVAKRMTEQPARTMAVPVEEEAAARSGAVAGTTSDPSRLASLETLAHQWSEAPNSPPLVFVFDQFEQYFTGQDYGTARDDKRFEADLARIVRRRELGAHVLISIRADAFYELNRLRPSVPDIFVRSVLLESLDQEAARDAITGPLGRWKEQGRDGPIEAEPDVVEDLLAEVQQAGTLQIETPYLQLALTRLWWQERQKNSRILHRETLHALGGATGIASGHFMQIMNGLSVDERHLCAAMFDRLVTPSGMKIALAPSDLAEMLEKKPEEVEAVLGKLDSGPSRIIHRIQSPQGVSSRFEIFHDVLARPILEWVATEEERTAHARELATVAADLARERRTKRRYAALAVLAGAALLIVLGTAGIAMVKHKEARAQRGRMLATEAERRLEAGDQRTALLLVLEALPHKRSLLDPVRNWLNWPDQDYALDVLDRALGTPIPREIRSSDQQGKDSERVTFAGFDPNGGMVTGTNTGAVDLWSANAVKKLTEWADPREVPHTRLQLTTSREDDDTRKDITSVTFDRHGRHIVTSDRSGVIRLWKIGKPNPVVTWSVGEGARAFASISPDGTRVATVTTGDRAPRLWAIRENDAANQDGAYKNIEVSVPWQASHRAGISSITFDPEGERLVTTSFGGVAAVWNIADGRLLQTFQHGGGGIFVARFSSDGRRLVTGGWDGKARIWNLYAQTAHPDCGSPCVVEDSKPTKASLTLEHDGQAVISASFDASGHEIVTTSRDGVVRIWNAETGVLLRRIKGPSPQPGSWFTAASLSRDGRRLVASSGQDGVLLWQLYGPTEQPRIRKIPKGVVAISADADGSRVAVASQTSLEITGSAGETLRLVDLDTPPLGVAMTPDGSRVALAIGDTVELLGTDHSGRDLDLPHTGRLVLSLAFDPDGQRLATASQDGSVRLWTAAGKLIGELLSTPHDPITALVFSIDSRLLYAGSTKGRIHIIDVASRQTLPSPELSQPADRAILALGFAPQGRYLVAITAGLNDGVPAAPVILDTAPPHAAMAAEGSLNRYLEALQAANVLVLAPAGQGGDRSSQTMDSDGQPDRVVVVPINRMLRPGVLPPPPEDIYGRISYAIRLLERLPEQDKTLTRLERCEHGLDLTGCASQGEAR